MAKPIPDEAPVAKTLRTGARNALMITQADFLPIQIASFTPVRGNNPVPCQHSSDGIDRTAGVHGHRLIRESDAEVGYEATSARIFDQMQNALEKAVLSLGSADVDNGGILEPGP